MSLEAMDREGRSDSLWPLRDNGSSDVSLSHASVLINQRPPAPAEVSSRT